MTWMIGEKFLALTLSTLTAIQCVRMGVAARQR
jgi:hypothetical protein